MTKSSLDETLDRLFAERLGIKVPVTADYIRKQREKRGELPVDEVGRAEAEAMGLEVLSPEQVKDAIRSFNELADMATD